jgi:hypothetical protein
MKKRYEPPQIVIVDATTAGGVRSTAQDSLSCPGESVTSGTPAEPQDGETGEKR